LSPFSDDKQNESTVFGTESEPLIRKTFALNFPNYIVKKSKGFESYISRKYPFIGASVDGLLVDKETQEKGILEIKTCDIRKKKDLEEWQDAIPMQYYCQILHYLYVMTDCSFVKVVAQLKMFDFSSELDNKVIELRTIIRHVERKDVEKDIEKLIALEKDFWLNNIEQRIPPSFKRSLN
jgi:predicted phage-related endonuclease